MIIDDLDQTQADSAPDGAPEDVSFDQALRPSAWEEYVGQDKVKRNLRIIIDAAKKRKEAMDHILLSGPAGLGKTTLAYLIAKELDSAVRTTSGPALEKMGDIAAIPPVGFAF